MNGFASNSKLGVTCCLRSVEAEDAKHGKSIACMFADVRLDPLFNADFKGGQIRAS